MDEFRKASREDVLNIQTLVTNAYQPYISRIGKLPGPMFADYDQLIKDDCVWVLQIDDVVAGVLVLLPQNGYLLLDNVAVDPRFQGRGIGKRLIDQAERIAADLRFLELRLYTNVAMTENLTFYSGLGFVETHRAVQDGYSRVFMRKPTSIQRTPTKN